MSRVNQNSLWILMVFTASTDDRNHHQLQTSLVIPDFETDLGPSVDVKMKKTIKNKSQFTATLFNDGVDIII